MSLTIRTTWFFPSLLLVLMLAAVTAANTPYQVRHQPVVTATIGEPVPITVRVVGAGDAAMTVTLFHASSGQIQQTVMQRGADDTFAATIPATVTDGLTLRYWVNVASPDFAFQIGTLETPMQIDLLEPPPPPSRPLTLQLAVGLASLALLAGSLRVRRARKRAAVLDELFWVRTLHPLLSLRPAELAPALLRLSRAPLDHPSRGLTMFPSSTIYERFRALDTIDYKYLTRRCRQFLEPGHPWAGLILPPPAPVRADQPPAPPADTAFVGMSTGTFRARLREQRGGELEFDINADSVDQPAPAQASSPRSPYKGR